MDESCDSTLQFIHSSDNVNNWEFTFLPIIKNYNSTVYLISDHLKNLLILSSYSWIFILFTGFSILNFTEHLNPCLVLMDRDVKWALIFQVTSPKFIQPCFVANFDLCCWLWTAFLLISTSSIGKRFSLSIWAVIFNEHTICLWTHVCWTRWAKFFPTIAYADNQKRFSIFHHSRNTEQKIGLLWKVSMFALKECSAP